MNMEQAAFLAAWQEDCDRISAQAASVVQRSEEVINRGEHQAYSAITREAEKLVAKSAGMSRDQAIARVLRERPELYSAYAAEHRLRLHMADVTDQNWRRKINKAWDDHERHERLLDSIASPASWAE